MAARCFDIARMDALKRPGRPRGTGSKARDVLRGERQRQQPQCIPHNSCPDPGECARAGHCLDLAPTLAPGESDADQLVVARCHFLAELAYRNDERTRLAVAELVQAVLRHAGPAEIVPIVTAPDSAAGSTSVPVSKREAIAAIERNADLIPGNVRQRIDVRVFGDTR